MVGTFWAFVPAIVAIVLALITKQVYVSLFVGIFVGALFYVGGNPINALGTLFQVMSEKVGANTSIIVFLVVLGIFVVLMQKSGGAKAYGEWAQTKIKTKQGALAATAALGCLIFVDDYFNCLTVGSVMRPVTDKFKVSHSKLAWIIDSTAAPVCIIAPISSWAAAVGSNLEGTDSIATFIKTIPFNIYAILTIIMIFVFCFIKLDFGKMKRNEAIAEENGDLDAGETETSADSEELVSNPKGKVRHLIVPVVVLIVSCILGMIYCGYFFNWGSELGIEFANADVISQIVNADGHAIFTLNNNADVLAALEDAGVALGATGDYCYYTVNALNQIEFVVTTPVSVTPGETLAIYSLFEESGFGTALQSGSIIEAFSNCDAGLSLAIGSVVALVIVGVYYMVTGVTSFKDITDSFTQGFKAMVPSILILTFAWTISGIMGAKGGYLDAQAFVADNVAKIPETLIALFPAIFFILAAAIAFSTGTSWGTFGVLVPLAVTVLGGSSTLAVLTVSATLGGAVVGDHISPISDTTIMASTGAACNHIDHVKTQLPYALMIAGISAVAYVVAGYSASLGSMLCAVIAWAVALVLFAAIIFVIKYIEKKKA